MSIYRPEDRHLPVRPDLDQLKHQAKDLLRAIRRGDSEAIEEFKKFHPQGDLLIRGTKDADRISAQAGTHSPPNLLQNDSTACCRPSCSRLLALSV